MKSKEIDENRNIENAEIKIDNVVYCVSFDYHVKGIERVYCHFCTSVETDCPDESEWTVDRIENVVFYAENGGVMANPLSKEQYKVLKAKLKDLAEDDFTN